MGLFSLFQRNQPDSLAPVAGRDIGAMNVMPSAAPITPSTATSSVAMPVNPPVPGVTLPAPTSSDTPAMPLGGLNVANKPEQKS